MPPKGGKGDKKGPPKSSFSLVGFEHSVEIIFILLFAAALFARFSGAFNAAGGGAETTSLFSDFGNYFSNHILPTLSHITYGISVIFLFGIVWSMVKFSNLNKAVDAIYKPKVSAAGAPVNAPVNSRWERVLTHLNSTNPNDWKFAILEGDIMLSDLLDTLQYQGDTMADKLKAVEKSDFTTIESAWEAHKIRNMVAHTGSDFVLTEREARRVIELYRTVFSEFKII